MSIRLKATLAIITIISIFTGAFFFSSLLFLAAGAVLSFFVYGFAVRRLRELENLNKTVKRRDELLRALNDTAVAMLAENGESFEGALQKGMKIIGRCVGVDNVEIWRNEMAHGELHAVLKHYRLGDGDGNQNIKSAPFVFKMPYSATPGWDVRFSRGEHINGPISSLSPEDQKFLSQFKMKSTIMLPLFIENQFWGFCCIDDNLRARTFTEDEINLLRSGCLIMALALVRHEMTPDIRASDLDRLRAQRTTSC